MQVVADPTVECDLSYCGGAPPPGEVSPSGSAQPVRVVKDAGCGGLCLYFQKVAATGYNVYTGMIGTWYSHDGMGGCGATVTDLGNGYMRYALGAGTDNGYYLVTAHNGTQEGTAGNPGRDAHCTCMP